MNDQKQSSDIVFLLGAGASVEAGVPDTFEFVKQFRGDQRGETGRTIEKVIDTLEKWRGSEIDVELLLEALTKLDAKKDEPLLSFFTGWQFVLQGYEEKRPIIEALRDFIKEKAIIRDDAKIRYLEPLLGFVEAHRPLDIFSLNYDTSIEKFCDVYKLNYQDGFDVNWNPLVFERENVDIRLYKLHGSVIWYRSNWSGYLKLPVMTGESGITLITGERAESLMLYPVQKFDYAEPLLELLMRFRSILKRCKILIVVGYSFRDAYLQKTLLDVARENRDLHVILVDPKAWNIYENKLKYFDASSKIPSSLDRRVICLPYRFEQVLPRLKNDYVQQLQAALATTSQCVSTERLGGNPRWVDCLRPLANAEHVERLLSLFENKINPSKFQMELQLYLEVILKICANLEANRREPEATEYLDKLRRGLRTFLVDRLDVDISKNGQKALLAFVFNKKPTPTGTSYQTAEQVKSFMVELLEYLSSRSQMIGSGTPLNTLGIVQRICTHLANFGPDVVFSIEQYGAMRKSTMLKGELDDIRNRLKLYMESTGADYRPLEESVKSGILEVEKRILADVLVK